MEASALFGVQALNWANKKFSGEEYGYWEQLGFEIGGPVCYVFAKFIDEYVSQNNMSNVGFIARDGWTLEKVFNIIKSSNASTSYVYAPRLINTLMTMGKEYKSEKELVAVTDYFKMINDGLRNMS